MWLLVGIAVLLSREVIASLNDENIYYSAETIDDGSLDGIEKPRYQKSQLDTSETRSYSETEEELAENGAVDDTIVKRGAKRSITNTDLRDKSLGQRQAPPPLATLLYWPERDDEVLGMDQRRNPLIQERRNPAFSPWGGKRDAQQRYQTIAKIRRPVRVPFNSWGGKRDGERIHQRAFTDLKKGKFFNWNGKQTPSFNSWADKNEISGIINDFSPSANYRYYQRRRKSSIVDVGQEVGDHIYSPESKYRDESSNNIETNEKRASPKMTASDEMTTSGSTMDETFFRVPFESWGGKKRRLFAGYSNDG